MMMLQETQFTFDDLFLNSSIESKDEIRLSGQAERILRLFIVARRDNRLVSNTALMAIGRQYQARLFEVRRFLVKHGFCIDLVKRNGNGVNYYSMVSVDKSTFYQQHSYSF
jgi:hypothetical protein